MKKVTSVGVLANDANELAKTTLRICPPHVITFVETSDERIEYKVNERMLGPSWYTRY